MKYTKEQAEQIKEKLKNLPSIEEKEEMTKQEMIKELKKEIKGLQKRGYSLEKIAEVLKGEGIEISIATLKNYLQRSSKPKASKTEHKKESNQ